MYIDLTKTFTNMYKSYVNRYIFWRSKWRGGSFVLKKLFDKLSKLWIIMEGPKKTKRKQNLITEPSYPSYDDTFISVPRSLSSEKKKKKTTSNRPFHVSHTLSSVK